MARDLLVAEAPTVLRANLYAVAALAGAAAVVVGSLSQLPQQRRRWDRRLLRSSRYGCPVRLTSSRRPNKGSKGADPKIQDDEGAS